MALLVRPTRLLRSAIVLKPSTLLALHKAMSKGKYRMLFSPDRRRQPGPKGASAELIRAVVEMKQRNPNWGCPRIAQQDRKSTRLNSSHGYISYAVFCLKKKTKDIVHDGGTGEDVLVRVDETVRFDGSEADLVDQVIERHAVLGAHGVHDIHQVRTDA